MNNLRRGLGIVEITVGTLLLLNSFILVPEQTLVIETIKPEIINYYDK